MAAFRIKRGAKGANSKAKRTPEFKATVLVKIAGGTEIKDALLESCKEFGTAPIPSYIDHPHTFPPNFETFLTRVVGNKNHKSHQSVVDILSAGGILDTSASRPGMTDAEIADAMRPDDDDQD